MLYPLKFKDIYIEKVWGGKKLSSVLNKKDISSDNIGESWEISGVEGKISVASEGFLKGKSLSEIIDLYKEKIVGGKIFSEFGSNFPLLIKFIDANDDLSVQVHPDNDNAKKLHNCKGKTELWYIVDAEPNSQLISGLNKTVTGKEFSNAISNKSIKELFNFIPVSKGDSFFIPSGKIHAIGKGILLAEIQQSSDITYRIYDWDRPDIDGRMRELHIENSLIVSDLTYRNNHNNIPKKITDYKNEIAKCEYFTVNKLSLSEKYSADYSDIDSFVIYMCTEGGFDIKINNTHTAVLKGETVLVPAEFKTIELLPYSYMEILEIYI